MNDRHRSVLFARLLLAMVLVVGLLHGSARPAAAATQIDIHGPAGSVRFGTRIAALPNGNFVVTDPEYDGGIGAEAGAVHLYNGATGARISTLTGSSAGDRVGSWGIIELSSGNFLVLSPEWGGGAGAVTWGSGTSGVSGPVSELNSLVGEHSGDAVGSNVRKLSNGNYVVFSPGWDDGGTADVGAATWGSGTGGVKGVVSAGNSLVGNHAGDQVGYAQFYYAGVVALSNGNYVVTSPYWNSTGVADAGAVTWGNGASGTTGLVSALNSLVGGQTNDRTGSEGVIALSNGNYVVRSPLWDRGAVPNAGAVTWGHGAIGVKGTVSIANSLVGEHAYDQVGNYGVTALMNGNYVVISSDWDNGLVQNVGAATWCDGTTWTSGAVSATNSLVGGHGGDRVGSGFVTALSKGNYVVASPGWNNGAVTDAGAVTWGDGDSGTSGPVSPDNSLVGSTADDGVGSEYVIPLSNGNYVALSPHWDNGGLDAGAATWGNGNGGTSGPISASNSLVGSSEEDYVGVGGVVLLSNGNYVVISSSWDNGGTVNVGAVTWGSGTAGVKGTVSIANSLVGEHANDLVGNEGVTALSNGNYVVSSRYWANGGAADAGAATWGDGVGGVKGVVSATNSLVGSTEDDQVGEIVLALRNGNYAVISRIWDYDAIVDAGAITWGNGKGGTTGPVLALNSLVGSTMYDSVGYGFLSPLSDGSYVIQSRTWDNGGIADAGAVSWGFGPHGAAGPISALNSVRGTTAGGGSDMVFDHDPVNQQLVVGRPADNLVTLFRLVHGVSVTPPTGAKSGAPGATVSYTLQVSNSGDLEDSLNLAAGGNAWTTTLPATVGPLAPGESASVTVSVTVPASAAGGATDSATITVASGADAAKTDTTTLTTTAGNVYAVAIAPPTSAKSGSPGTSVSYTLQVTNAGNTAQSFNLAAGGNRWTTNLPATVGPLAAGASQNVTITVSVPASAASGSADTALVTVACQADNTKKDTAALTTTAGVRKIYMPVVRKK